MGRLSDPSGGGSVARQSLCQGSVGTLRREDLVGCLESPRRYRPSSQGKSSHGEARDNSAVAGGKKEDVSLALAPAHPLAIRARGLCGTAQAMIPNGIPPPQGVHRMRHDYAGVVERQERLGAPLIYAWRALSHLLSVKNSEALREVYEELQVRREALGVLVPWGSSRLGVLAGMCCRLDGRLGDEDRWMARHGPVAVDLSGKSPLGLRVDT